MHVFNVEEKGRYWDNFKGKILFKLRKTPNDDKYDKKFNEVVGEIKKLGMNLKQIQRDPRKQL